MPFDGDFDATQVAPKQGGGAHPVGNKFPFTITSTKTSGTKDNSGGMFEVEFTSPAGSIVERYNLWNQSEAARNIAKQELSALCHAVGIFKLNFRDDGKALMGAKGLMDIGFQKGHEPSADKPEGGYVELKKVYDLAGNEPGRAPVNQQSQQPNQFAGNGQAPQQTNNSAGFGQQVNAPSNVPANGGSWGNQQQAPQQNQPQQNWGGPPQNQQQPMQQNNNGGWQQSGNVPQQAPWGNS